MTTSLKSVALVLASFLVLLASHRCPATEPFDPAHSAWARVLSDQVDETGVDYARLKDNPGDLDRYLDAVAAVAADDFARWPRENRLATLLNLYNAQTLRLIIDHYPLKSIRDIGLLPGAAWRKKIVRFGGETLSLDHLEHHILRPLYREPRIHFALVCAARGCPPLRREPYVGAHLETQLDDQARRFLANRAKNRFDAASGTLWLSPIFDWYQRDFTETAGSLATYVEPFLPESTRTALSHVPDARIRFTDYDWSLNDRRP